jgi:hypothetical protein
MRHGAKTIALHLTIDCRRRAMLGLWRTVWTYIQTIYLYITRSAPAVRLQQTGCKFCAGGSEEFLAEMVRWVGQVTIPESRNLPPPLLRELSDIHPWTTTTHPCVQHIHTYIHAYIYTYIHTYIHTYTHTYIHTLPGYVPGDVGDVVDAEPEHPSVQATTPCLISIHGRRRRTPASSTYIHTYIHTYIYTYIHTYIHTCLPLPNLA